MSNQLAVAQQAQSLSINDMGNVFVKSGFFADTRDQAQAIVKILAGQELGISPIASMTGLYIVKGKPSLGANLIAACIKNSGRYNYKVLTLSAEVCEIEFYEKFDAGEKFTKSGTSKFTIEDARKAGTQNIDKFPRNMLFARAMSNGAKWYCASIFAGGVYTPDELGATVQYDEAGDIKNVIDGEVKEPEPAKPIKTKAVVVDGEMVQEPIREPAPEQTKETQAVEKKTYERPLSPEDLKHLIEKKAEGYAKKTVNEKQIGLTASMMEWPFAGQQHTDKIRHTITKYLVGYTSLKDTPAPLVHALLDWLKPVQDSGGEYTPDEMAVKEIKSVWTAALKAEGQGELPL